MSSIENSLEGEGESLSSIVREAKVLLGELQDVRARSDELLQATETARKHADSEGLFAVNAKKTCEEHATAVSQIKATVEVDVGTIATNKQKTDELLAAINVGKASVDGDVKTISDHRKEIGASAQRIIDDAATGSSHLQKIVETMESAESTVKAIGGEHKVAQQARTRSDAAIEKTERIAETAQTLCAAIGESHKTGTQQQSEIEQLLTEAKNSESNLKHVLERLTKSNESATAFETRVKQSATDLESLIKQTESLLPGVTSASLASAFGKQAARFSSPKRQWLLIFIVCIVGLVGLAVPSYTAVLRSSAPETWAEIVRGFLMRLPIMAPLVWLGIYAGRNYMLSIRLEEDYAYKEAISISFEGYKREMEKIQPGEAGSVTPLNILCENVLTAMANRPGRIYEGKAQDITPLNEGRVAVQRAFDAARKKQVATE